MSDPSDGRDSQLRLALEFVVVTVAGALITDQPRAVMVVIGLSAALLSLVVGRRARTNRRLAAALGVLSGPRLTGVLVLVAVVAASSTAAYVLAVRRTPKHTAAEHALLALLQPRVARLCAPATPDRSGMLASVRCHDAAAGIDARFSLAASTGAMHQALRATTRAAALRPGRCFSEEAAYGPYDLQGISNAGTLACDATGRRLWWTNDRLLVFAEATKGGATGSTVLQWWSDSGGAVTTAPPRRPFPDEDERRLLLHVPTGIRPACRRDAYTFSGAIVAVRCQLSTRTVDTVWYVSVSNPATMAARIRQSAKDVTDSKASCTNHGRHVALAPYRDGLRLCYDEGRTSWIEWTDDQAHVYAYASHSPNDLDALYRWWTTSPGPV